MPAGREEERSREVRLGVVMYGGVSLAVYIYGVAEELFRAVRGRGVYRLVKALTDSDIVVDVISGTSAGGINGLMLAYALCNEREFTSVSSLWREDGDIRRLLRSPLRSCCPSLLDSEGYYQPALERAFTRMSTASANEGDSPSPVQELDLFVTGTDVDGNCYTTFDDAGNPIDVKDHRTVFHLKHRRGRKEPFKPCTAAGGRPDLTHRALAKLARITSCFPAAFTPVRVMDAPADDATVDGKLQLWGRIGREACFLDGGVIDNKPFTHTLGAIYSRSADRTVDRKLLYIDPDPERFEAREGASSPNAAQAVVAALLGIPGYESISDDLKSLADRNSRLHQYRRLTEDLARQCPRVMTAPEASTQAADEAMRTLYERSRFVFLCDKVVDGLLKSDGRRERIAPEDLARAAGLVEYFDREIHDRSLLDGFDVHFASRRAFRVIYLIYDLLHRDAGSAAAPAAGYRKVWLAFNRLTKLHEILAWAMEELLGNADFHWRDKEPSAIWSDIGNAFQHLLATGSGSAKVLPADFTEDEGWLGREQLRAYHATLGAELKEIVRRVSEGRIDPPERFESVLARLERYERQILGLLPEGPDPVREAYERFPDMDAALFPVEMMGGLHEKDIIETVRISPGDADRGFSRNNGSNKVSGSLFYHFGGFFKRSWRANDILWGRLDGLCQLLEVLVSRERLAALSNDSLARERIRGALARPEMKLDGILPGSTESTRNELAVWLDDLFGEQSERRQKAVDLLDERLGLLIAAAQLEVLHEQVPEVMKDALFEQASWNHFRTLEEPAGEATPSYDPQRWSFKAGKGPIDPFLSALTAVHFTDRALASLTKPEDKPARPEDTAMGKFFRGDYRVGSETMSRDIPPLAHMEVLSVALLVVRNCLLGLMGENGERIRRNLVFRTFVSGPLWAFYGLVFLLSRQRGLGMVAAISLVSASLLYGAGGIAWVTRNGWPGLEPVLLFVGPPLLVILIVLLTLWLLFRMALAPVQADDGRQTSAGGRERPA